MLVEQRARDDGVARDLPKRLQRATRALAPGATPAEAAAVVLDVLVEGIGAAGGAVVVMDPQTALFTTGAVHQLPAPSCHPFFRFEVESGSERTFRRLAATGAGAVALLCHAADDGYAERVLRPYGYADEVRVIGRHAGTSWVGVSLWRRPSEGPFTRADEESLDLVAAEVGSIMRDAVVRSVGAVCDPGTRHVVVVEGEHVVESSERSSEDLEQLADPDVEEYRHLDHLKELARRDPSFSTVIGMADGRWLSAHGVALGSGRVAIVLASASPADLFGVVVAGAGLTPREVEITRLLCRGHSDAEIAALLVISPHTVHDHVRAVRSKLGVRSRAEVAAKVFAERYFDGFLSTAAVTHAST